ncbi:PAS domain-containing protein [Paraburkholderia phenazinium]|uniref:PAS domain-containing protein n=1 Tax=Paraburkholderia phenazinium TaxID=60549 RepID=A0A1G8LLS4_9BURK|nr:PAS domain-containing protein [Paraburkholderia phenazinium]SDI56661.1 PAS domain-containing protein [Paraburkholderia phenazinium]
MVKLKSIRVWRWKDRRSTSVKAERRFVPREAARKAITAVAVVFILSAIALSTFLALRQTREQDEALRTLHESGLLKRDLDQVQQMMLDEHGELYTQIETRAFYKRDAFSFPLRALLELTSDARGGCRQNAICPSRLADLDDMAGELSKRHFERKAFAVDGSPVWISETKLPLEDQNRAIIGVLTAYENITARRDAELALRLQSRAIDASINGLMIAEVKQNQHVIMFANAAFERITGYSASDVIGADCEDLFALAGEASKWSAIASATRC